VGPRRSDRISPIIGATSIKVNSDEAGHATTNGIVAFREAIAAADAPHLQKLRDAGAVFVGRNNTPAFSYRWFTANDLHGRTLNPWDARRAPGARAAAQRPRASGMLQFAHGNDIGGSIRYPAYACGIVGIRPTVDPAELLASDDLVEDLSVERRRVLAPRGRVPKVVEETEADRASGYRLTSRTWRRGTPSSEDRHMTHLVVARDRRRERERAEPKKRVA
jgi:amidase